MSLTEPGPLTGSMQRARNKKGGRFGRLAFFLPLIVILGVGVYALAQTIFFGSGTLAVDAETSGRYYTPRQLTVTASVHGKEGTTPFNLTLTQGTYIVTYGSIMWYITPADRSITVPAGRTAYAVGVYGPIVRTITMTAKGFNTTSVTAGKGITPVVWINQTPSDAVLQFSDGVKTDVRPNQNYTRVFQSSGTYSFSWFDTDFAGAVQVS